MKSKKEEPKFKFNSAYQFNILKYVVTDKKGWRILKYIKPEYFELINHQIVAKAIFSYYKKWATVPRDAATLTEVLKQLYSTKEFAESLKTSDRKQLEVEINKSLYNGLIKNPESILESITTFASYVEFSKAMDKFSIDDHDSYSAALKSFQQAVNVGRDVFNDRGIRLLNDADSRLNARHRIVNNIAPIPFEGMGRFINSGGYTKGSLVVFIDKPKAGKTMFLVNVGRYLIRQKMNVVYFDLENGQEAIACRFDQSFANKTKKEVLSGKQDIEKTIRGAYRKHKKVGTGELYIKRMPARSTINDMQAYIDEVKEEDGVEFDVALVDYVGLMGSTDGKTEDEPRISGAYIDVKNFAEKNDLMTVYTGHHVTRQGYSDRTKRHKTTNLAKCIEIERHVDAIWGIQQNPIEKAHDLIRIELLVQRDGSDHGRVLFDCNMATQRITQISRERENAYYSPSSPFQEGLKDLRDEDGDWGLEQDDKLTELREKERKQKKKEGKLSRLSDD